MANAENYLRTRGYLRLLRETANAWYTHRASSMGAALAFYTSFSLTPVLLIAIAVAGLVFGADAARGEVIDQISGLVGKPGAEAVQSLLQNAYQPGRGLLASAIALVVLLISATTVFVELKNSLDIVWNTKPGTTGIVALLRERLLSFGLILTLGFLLLVSLMISASLAALQKYWGTAFHDAAWLLEALNSLVSFAVVTILFTVIYKWLPEPHIAWRDVAIGAVFTSILFMVGKFLIGLYLGNSALASSYGAAGSLMVVLFWVYYSSQIFLFGAEFTRTFSERRGSRRGASDVSNKQPSHSSTARVKQRV